jgi:hypothetical protein
MLSVKGWQKIQGKEDKEPLPKPKNPALTYAYVDDAEAGWRLLVEVPILEQEMKKRFLDPRTWADNRFPFIYLRVNLTTGAMARHYSSAERIALADVQKLQAMSGGVFGWTFMLGAIELVNANQFNNHQYPQGWVGFEPIWDIASMMGNGERALLVRSAYPQELMLKFANQLRQLIAPFQAVQRENQPDHVRLYKMMQGKEQTPERASLREKLRALYADFQPPELLF